MTRSSINNCYVIVDWTNRPIMELRDQSGGDAFVKLDRYLICPREMFTQAEIDAAHKRYEREQHGRLVADYSARNPGLLADLGEATT